MKTILILDDDENIRSTFGIALRHHGYRVIDAGSGEEGLELARKHLPDLVLTDISMPGMGGQDVLQTIRETPELSGKQVVLMTGQTQVVSPRKGMELGADDFLIKPIGLDDLLQCIEARLKRAQIHWRVEDRMLSKLRDSLHSSLPHELFTPLAGIIGLVEVLQTNLATTSLQELDELLKDVHTSGVNLHRTLRNYLLILDLDSGGEGTRPPAEKLSPEMTRKCILYGIQSARRDSNEQREIRADIAECAVAGNFEEIGVIVEELVDNALKFSSKDKRVDVRFDANAELTVTDQGRGMTPEEIDQLGAFRQFDRKKLQQRGLGIGLSLAQKLAAKCGASFSIDSKPGVGTTVKVAFRPAPVVG